MVDVTSEIVIDRPKGAVAAYAADPDNVTSWYANITSVEWLSPRPLATGTRLRFHARFLGRELSYVYEVTEFLPGHRLVMQTSEGPFPMETAYQWTDAGPGATRMTLRNRGKPRGFSALVSPMMSIAVRRENRKDLRRLKSRLELG